MLYVCDSRRSEILGDYKYLCRFFFFFFQAEDGIRDVAVTGVQTCALPISAATLTSARRWSLALSAASAPASPMSLRAPSGRSEERRVGKECRVRGSAEV